MSKSILNSILYDALPDSIRDDKDVKAIADSLDIEIKSMAEAAKAAQWASPVVDSGTIDGSRLQLLSGEQLDHIAWSWGSVVWDRDWNEAKKRAYIVGILNRKKHLGTAECIRDAFSTIGVNVEVADCMTDSSISPGRFMLYTDDPIIMSNQWRMLYIIDNIKPASRHYNWGHRVSTDSALYAGAGAKPSVINRIAFDTESEPLPTICRAFSRGGSYQGRNQTLTTNTPAYIYAQGESGTLNGDPEKDYIIKLFRNAAETELSFDKVFLNCYGGKLRIQNCNLGVSFSWNDVFYQEKDTFEFWFNREKTNETFSGSGGHTIYHSSGIENMYRDANETYTVVGVYTADGTPVHKSNSPDNPLLKGTVRYFSTFHRFSYYPDYNSTYTAAYVVFTVQSSPVATLSMDEEE